MSTKQGRALRLGAKLAEGQVFEVFELLEYPSMPIGARLVLKKIRPALAQDDSFRNRLHKLFELLPKLRHPYAEEVLDAKAAGPDETFLVCERLDGESLADMLRREGRLPLSTARQLARQIAEALLAGHALCVIHGNLTPSHIVINQPRRDEPRSPLRIKVRGFGLAPPLGGPLYGTPSYLAPEQVDFMSPRPQATQLSDQHALAILIYEALVGSFLFPGGSLDSVRTRLLRKDPTPFELRGVPEAMVKRVTRTIERALAKVPESRYQRLLDFVEALEGNRTESVFLPAHRSSFRGSGGPPKVLPPVRLLRPTPQTPDSPKPEAAPEAVPGPVGPLLPPNGLATSDADENFNSDSETLPFIHGSRAHDKSSVSGFLRPLRLAERFPKPDGQDSRRSTKGRVVLPVGLALCIGAVWWLLKIGVSGGAQPGPSLNQTPPMVGPQNPPPQPPSAKSDETVIPPLGQERPAAVTNPPPQKDNVSLPQPVKPQPLPRSPACRLGAGIPNVPLVQRVGTCFTARQARRLGPCAVRVLYSQRKGQFSVDAERASNEAQAELEVCLNRLTDPKHEFSQLPDAGLSWICR